ncbi:hypothetical protein [Sphingomonas oryzagri]|uniref:Uncharacterized protein n=1 Tax=Sphingomonas oryzagri TaxID=3042314 RepID=A0ABT6MZU1_9SPHN|nr:hypothetical protein [Sphingomonas oryzagri]MDH7638575.1 hypothetical protein [Sphingomonas oryzagri]
MEPAEQTTIFALLSILFFLISLFADDERWWVSVGCTGLLVCYWAFNTILWMLGVVEDWSLPSDGLFALGALALAVRMRRGWLLALFGLFAVNLVLDVLHVTNTIDYATWAEAGNISFVCQLATASFPGLVSLTRMILSRPRRV